MKMNIFSLRFLVFIIYFIPDLIACRNIVDFVEEDLAPFYGAKLDDENYEIVQFWYGERANGKGLRIKRSDRNETWYIDEAPILRERVPVWLVYNKTTIVKADENIISDAIKLHYEPQLAMSVAVKFDDNNHLYLAGSISKMNIVPLSNRAARSIREKKPHLFENFLKPGTVDETNNFTMSGYHILYEPKREKSGNIVLPQMGSPEFFRKSTGKINGTSHNRSKRSISYTVYPEILVVLDYDERYSSIYEVRFLDLLIYTFNFWNAVNLRFKSLFNPKVQLKITGIMVNMVRGGIPVIKNALNDRGLEANNVLAWMAHWLKNRIPKTYDIIITQTNSHICTHRGAPCIAHIAGISRWIVPCDQKGDMLPSGLIYDDMHYTGIESAVYEIGHLLGATPAGFSSKECPQGKEHVIFKHLGNTDEPFSWSPCTQREISHNLRSSAVNCYNNESPSEDQGDLVELLSLPGSRISLQTQCRARFFSDACYSENVCKELLCKDFIWCENSGPALDGTPCAIGECRMGLCVPVVTNLTMNLQKLSSLDDS